MTDEQINKAIAEACGICHVAKVVPMYKTAEGWVIDCPNFCSDLNAMHDAEKTLDEEQWHDYVEHVGGTWEQAMHATARQRAEAFLRTLGKWEGVHR